MDKNKKIKFILKYIGNTFYYTVLSTLIFIVLLVAFSRISWLGNYRLLVVQSGSMEPAIHTGAVVLVEPQAGYQPGDIVTYQPKLRSQQTITHRIQQQAQKNGQLVYITKGDANEDVDFAPVKRQQIIGKVMVNVPYLGYAIAAAKTKLGFIFLIIAPVLIIVFDQSKRIIKEIKKLKQDKMKSNN